MNDHDSYNHSKKQVDIFREFLNESRQRPLSEKSIARSLGPSLRKAVRGNPEEPPETRPEAPKKPQGYRGSKVQIFSGDNSVKQALSNTGLSALHVGRILDALQKDFEEAGLEVMEKKSRKVINLNNTLQLLESMSFDIEQRKQIAAVLYDLLRLHRVKMNNFDGTWIKQWADVADESPHAADVELPPEAPGPEEEPPEEPFELPSLDSLDPYPEPGEINYDERPDWVEFIGIADQNDLVTGHPLNDGRMGLYRVVELDHEDYGKLIFWRPGIDQYAVAPDDAKPVDN